MVSRERSTSQTLRSCGVGRGKRPTQRFGLESALGENVRRIKRVREQVGLVSDPAGVTRALEHVESLVDRDDREVAHGLVRLMEKALRRCLTSGRTGRAGSARGAGLATASSRRSSLMFGRVRCADATGRRFRALGPACAAGSCSRER